MDTFDSKKTNDPVGSGPGSLRAGQNKPGISQRSLPLTSTELARLSGTIPEQALIAAIEATKERRAKEIRDRLDGWNIGEAAQRDEWAQKLAADEIAEGITKLPSRELPPALVEARNELRKRLVRIRHVLESYRKITGQNALTREAKDALEMILRGFDQANDKHGDRKGTVQVVEVERAGENEWRIVGDPLTCEDWHPPGVQLKLAAGIGDADYHEPLRTVLQDACPGAQFVVGGGDTQVDLINHWAQDEEIACFTPEDWSKLEARDGDLIEMLGLNRAAQLYLKILGQMMGAEQATLRTQDWVVSAEEQQQEAGVDKMLDVKERIKVLRTRLEADLEAYISWLTEEEGKIVARAKVAAAEALQIRIQQFHDSRAKGENETPPLLTLQQSAGDENSPEDKWMLNRNEAKALVYEKVKHLRTDRSFKLADHVMSHVVASELERLRVPCEDLTMLPFEPSGTALEEAANQLGESALPAQANNAPQNPVAMLREGWRLTWRKLFVSHPFQAPLVTKPDSEPVWPASPAPGKRGNLAVILGLLKEAASAPMKILGPIFAIFAPLMILGIANPLKRATKGISDGLNIPDGFLPMFLLAVAITVCLVVALMAAWRYRAEGKLVKSSLLPFGLLCIFAIGVGLGFLPRGVEDSAQIHRHEALRTSSMRAFMEDPDDVTEICMVWFRHLRVFYDELMILDSDHSSNTNPAAPRGSNNSPRVYDPIWVAADPQATDAGNGAMTKTLTRWDSLSAEFETRLGRVNDSGKLKSFHGSLENFIKTLRTVEESKQPVDAKREDILKAALEFGVHPFQEMLWWKLKEILRMTLVDAGMSAAVPPQDAVKLQRGLRDLAPFDKARTDRMVDLSKIIKDKEAATPKQDAGPERSQEKAATECPTKVKQWVAVIRKFTNAEYKGVMEQIRTMPTDQWVMLSDATVGYRGDRWGQSWTLGNAVNGVRPITAAASSASPTEADLDQIRWQAPTANSTPGAINLLSRVKRSAVVLSQMKANADIAKAIANVPEAEAQVAKTDAKVAELVQGLWQNGATETATMTKTEDATRSWMASKPTWILLIITVLVVAMLLGCAAFTGAKEGSHAAWCAALFAGVAALCAWGTIQLYYNVAAGNDAEHVKQRLVNGLTTESSVWKDTTHAALLESPYAMLMTERVRAIPESERINGVEIGPRSDGRPLGALGVFTALFLALLWSGLWARRDLQQKHDAAIAAAISQAKQRALTEYNQNVELAFKEWSTKTSASGRTWLSNAIRSVELRLEEAERKNQESNRKKTAQIAKDRADLKCRHERLKELKKSTAAAESAALAVRNSGIKALQA